jgi:pimeloyl-ACP methyl ester carboxylesterase
MTSFLDKYGNIIEYSVSEKVRIEVNQIKQGMIIRGESISNPVLLFLHGGPGMPEYFLAEKYLVSIEKHFTICYLEQRGGGLSYSSNMQATDITVEQLINDAVEVTNYLRTRFAQEKIYLMGHSWGTFIGMQVAAKMPELYHAYIGVGQISQQLESEKLAYTYMLEQYEIAENARMVRKFKEYQIYTSDIALSSYLSSSLRDKAMHALGVGTMRNMNSIVTGIFWPVMRCRAYTLIEKINIWRGKVFLKKATELYTQMYTTDLTVEVTRLEIPIYFFSGIYDYTVSYALTKDYYERLQASVKGFYTFKKSAHSPIFEETEQSLKIMREDVIPNVNHLAD